jgi:hypothetical protein
MWDPITRISAVGYFTGIPHTQSAMYLRSSRAVLSEFKDHCVSKSYPVPLIANAGGYAGDKPGSRQHILSGSEGGYYMKLSRGESEKSYCSFSPGGTVAPTSLSHLVFSQDVTLDWKAHSYFKGQRWTMAIPAENITQLADIPALDIWLLLEKGPKLIPAGTIISVLIDNWNLISTQLRFNGQFSCLDTLAQTSVALSPIELIEQALEISHKGAIGATPYESFNDAISKLAMYYTTTTGQTWTWGTGFTSIMAQSPLRINNSIL